jgi:hypothetical protein
MKARTSFPRKHGAAHFDRAPGGEKGKDVYLSQQLHFTAAVVLLV